LKALNKYGIARTYSVNEELIYMNHEKPKRDYGIIFTIISIVAMLL